MHSPRSRCPSHSRARLCVAVLPILLLTGCLGSSSDAPLEPTAPTGSVDIAVSPWRALSARGSAIEPGGRLVLELRDPGRRRQWLDSLEWDGTKPASLSFRNIPQGGNYLLSGRYRDASGRYTHADSLSPVSVAAGEQTIAQLRLRALIGRLVFSMPSVPAAVASLQATWKNGDLLRQATTERGTGGRTILRLDSLAVGSTGQVSLRAWNPLGDTLYFLDTILTISRDADQSVSLVWRDASAQAGIQASALPGGDLNATLRFPGEGAPDGRLRISGLSDSGASDWVLLENPGTDTVRGKWKILHGAESATLEATIAPGSRLVATRTTCANARDATHILHREPALACEVDLPVAWSAPSALWELQDDKGSLVDQVAVWDGQNGWPDLNASTARTLRRRGAEAGRDAMAGRSWCAHGSGDPAQPCP